MSWRRNYPKGRDFTHIELTESPPPTPKPHFIYKHPTADSKGISVPMLASSPIPVIVPVLTAVQGAIAAGSLEDWHTVGGGGGEPGFGGTWANFAGFSLQFKKYLDGSVEITGLVTTGVYNTTVFTLPTGYRPTQQRDIGTYSEAAGFFGTFKITTAGAVVPVVGAGAISLDCRFFAGA